MVRSHSAAVESANQELRMLEHDTEVFRRQFFDWLSRHVERNRDQHELFEKSLARLISNENELNHNSDLISSQIKDFLIKRDDFLTDARAVESQKNSNEKILASMPQIIQSSSKELNELERQVENATLEKQFVAKQIEQATEFMKSSIEKTEKILGLKIEFMKEVSALKVIFTSIDPQDHTKEFSVILGIASDPIEIVFSSPHLPAEICSHIIETTNNSLAALIRSIRSAFKSLIAS
jgi:hypothetical protein